QRLTGHGRPRADALPPPPPAERVGTGTPVAGQPLVPENPFPTPSPGPSPAADPSPFPRRPSGAPGETPPRSRRARRAAARAGAEAPAAGDALEPGLESEPGPEGALEERDPGRGGEGRARATRTDRAGLRDDDEPGAVAEPDDEVRSPAAVPSRSRARSRTRQARRFGVPRLLDRRTVLVAATVVALLAGVGTGAVVSLLGPDDPAVVAATPEHCAAAQTAWTQSAAQQVRMDAADPATLRSGFLGARDALAAATPPPAVADDWGTVQRYVGTVATAVEGVDAADPAAVEAAVAEALGGLDTAAMTAAAGHVTAYLKAGCTE
ncbi:hypothetical protein DNL40_10705, partial [Xylanimonas oleitrophica]